MVFNVGFLIFNQKLFDLLCPCKYLKFRWGAICYGEFFIGILMPFSKNRAQISWQMLNLLIPNIDIGIHQSVQNQLIKVFPYYWTKYVFLKSYSFCPLLHSKYIMQIVSRFIFLVGGTFGWKLHQFRKVFFESDVSNQPVQCKLF